MNASRSLAVTKLHLSLRSIWGILLRPPYLALALLLGFIFFEIVYWAFNMSILAVVLGSGLGIGEKIMFLLSPFRDIFTTTSVVAGTLILLVAVVQGINLALLTYLIRYQRRLSVAAVGGGSIAGLLAVVGLGCSVCGTSLLVPIVAIFASTSAIAISEKLTVVAPLVALMVGIVGAYYLGLQVANNLAVRQQAESTFSSK